MGPRRSRRSGKPIPQALEAAPPASKCVAMSNPLLDFKDLPLFDQVRPEHVSPAMDELLGQADQALATVTQPDFPADWMAMAKVLDVATERLGRAWGMVGHLNAVADTPELRAAYNEALPRV